MPPLIAFKEYLYSNNIYFLHAFTIKLFTGPWGPADGNIKLSQKALKNIYLFFSKRN